MKSNVTTLESNKIKLSVALDENEIDAAIDEAFKKIAKEVRLPGFRPGKAPRKVLEAHIGRGQARAEAIRESLPNYYRQAIIEHDVDVIAPPDLDITSGEDDGPVEFEAVVEIRPTVIVAGYDGLRIEVPSPEASDEEIEKQIDSLREQFAERVEVDRAAIEGDHVTMDITGTHDGEPVDSLSAQDYTYEVGAGFVVDEIDEALIDSNVGDVVEFDADHPDPDEEGRLSFRVEVKKIEAKQLPELNDEFVAEATEFATVAELTDDTRKRIETAKRSQSPAMIANKTGTALAELVTEDIPDALVDDAVQSQIQDMAMRLAGQGIGIEQFLEMTGQNIQDLMQNMREPAAEAARVDLALRAVVVAEGLEVSDEELEAEIKESADEMSREPAELRTMLETNGQLSSVRIDMAKRKAMEWLTESVEIVDEDGQPIDRARLEPIEPTPEAADETEPADGSTAIAPEGDEE